MIGDQAMSERPPLPDLPDRWLAVYPERVRATSSRVGSIAWLTASSATNEQGKAIAAVRYVADRDSIVYADEVER